MRLNKKKRIREIEYERMENIKEVMRFSNDDMAELLGVSVQQLGRYKRCGYLPALRYYAFRDALLLANEDKARKDRDEILTLFN
jgi:hypothetical protein